MFFAFLNEWGLLLPSVPETPLPMIRRQVHTFHRLRLSFCNSRLTVHLPVEPRSPPSKTHHSGTRVSRTKFPDQQILNALFSHLWCVFGGDEGSRTPVQTPSCQRQQVTLYLYQIFYCLSIQFPLSSNQPSLTISLNLNDFLFPKK